MKFRGAFAAVLLALGLAAIFVAHFLRTSARIESTDEKRGRDNPSSSPRIEHLHTRTDPHDSSALPARQEISHQNHQGVAVSNPAPNKTQLDDPRRESGTAAPSDPRASAFATGPAGAEAYFTYSLGGANAAQPGSFASGAADAIMQPGDLPVPSGAAVPVAFYDNTERPEPQKRALQRIQSNFARAVSVAGGGSAPPEVWEKAKEAADRQYIKIFGFANYNRLSIQAAKEALPERHAAMAAGAKSTQ